MDQRERIAHHEAAHAVMMIFTKVGVPPGGISIDLVNPATSGLGSVDGRLYDIDLRDLSGPALEARQKEEAPAAMCNGLVILAGAVADAKVEGRDAWDCLIEQTSDLSQARDMLRRGQYASVAAQEDQALKVQLDEAKEVLEEREIWAAVQAVARAVLKTGKLSGPEIEAITDPFLAQMAARKKASRSSSST